MDEHLTDWIVADTGDEYYQLHQITALFEEKPHSSAILPNVYILETSLTDRAAFI